jgi:hypothetical protein
MPLRGGTPREQLLVSAVFTLVCGGVVVGALVFLAPDIWAALAYRPTEAVVAERRMVEHTTSKRGKYYRLETLLTYTVDGREYQARTVWGAATQTRSLAGADAEAVLARVPPGHRVTCWYDRFQPSRATVEKGGDDNKWWLLVAAAWAAVMFCFGARGVVVAWRAPRLSPEKRAAEPPGGGAGGAEIEAFFARLATSPAGQPRPAGPPGTAPGRRPAFPGGPAGPVPVGRGERLAVRLRASPLMNNALLLVGYLYVTALLLVGGFGPVRRGALSPAFLAVSAAGVVALAYGCWRQVRRVADTVVEVSEHPLRAGAVHDVAVSHPDPRALRTVRLTLVGAQRSGEGKQSKSEVFRQPVPLTPPEEPGGAWTGRVEVPRTAASIALSRNRVTWSFNVRPRRWGPGRACYPVEVRGPALSGLPSPQRAAPPTRLDVEELTLWVDGSQAVFAPGTVLTGGFQVRRQGTAGRLRGVELSVLWEAGTPAARPPWSFAAGNAPPRLKFTELGVCHFEEYEAAGGDDAALYAPRPFRAVLPEGPPSFPGPVVQVEWAARLRLRYANGDEVTHDLPFLLVPAGAPGQDTSEAPARTNRGDARLR